MKLIQAFPTVLPHEKLYLEHLPSANRYYKSFMHRDQINFVTMTKYVHHHHFRITVPPLFTLYCAQDKLSDNNVPRWTRQAVEETRRVHRVCQALSSIA